MGSWVAFLSTTGFPSFPRPGVQIQLSDEAVDKSASEAEVETTAEVFSGAPDRAPFLGDSGVPPGASPSTSPTGALPFDSSTSASQGPTLGV